MELFSHYLLDLAQTPKTILIFSLVVALGVAFGNIPIFGIRLGGSGVLFAGILFGHAQWSAPSETLDFVRNLGLILFIYSIGLQVGPAFFSTFKRSGLFFLGIATSYVALGIAVMVAIGYLTKWPLSLIVGMMNGATTNTASLASAQQVLHDSHNASLGLTDLSGVGYAVCYPFGMVGIIVALVLFRKMWGIRIDDEVKTKDSFVPTQHQNIEAVDILVENKNLDNILIRDIPGLSGSNVIVSRIVHNNIMSVTYLDLPVRVGDIIRAVGPKKEIEEFIVVVGSRTVIDESRINSSITTRRVVVSHKEVYGKTLSEIDAFRLYGVTVARIQRGDVEFVASSDVDLRFGDRLLVVGDEAAIAKFAQVVGNSIKHLDEPMLVPLFVGIALGVILGQIPIYIPGIVTPVKLGLAAGPLLVAIALSSIGRIGNLIWYMPTSANFMLREFGISLFLASTGLVAGDSFFSALQSGEGYQWMIGGMAITLIPLLIMAPILRGIYKMNYFTLAGIVSGSCTNPPALAYANGLSAVTNTASVGYSSVYPFVMILRIIAAQLILIIGLGQH